MEAKRQAEVESKSSGQKYYAVGATEDQMDNQHTVPQRIDRWGSKVEDLAGTGVHDSSGG